MTKANQDELLAIVWIIAAILAHNSSYVIPSAILTFAGLFNLLMSIYLRIYTSETENNEH